MRKAGNIFKWNTSSKIYALLAKHIPLYLVSFQWISCQQEQSASWTFWIIWNCLYTTYSRTKSISWIPSLVPSFMSKANLNDIDWKLTRLPDVRSSGISRNLNVPIMDSLFSITTSNNIHRESNFGTIKRCSIAEQIIHLYCSVPNQGTLNLHIQYIMIQLRFTTGTCLHYSFLEPLDILGTQC